MYCSAACRYKKWSNRKTKDGQIAFLFKVWGLTQIDKKIKAH